MPQNEQLSISLDHSVPLVHVPFGVPKASHPHLSFVLSRALMNLKKWEGERNLCLGSLSCCYYDLTTSKKVFSWLDISSQLTAHNLNGKPDDGRGKQEIQKPEGTCI